MKRVILTLTLSISILLSCFSQESNNSFLYEASKSRIKITKRLAKKKVDSTEISDLIHSLEKFAYFSLWEEEKLLLIIGQYDSIIQKFTENENYAEDINGTRVLSIGSKYLASRFVFLHLYSSSLQIEIDKFLKIKKRKISLKIEGSNLPQEHKEFVKLLLNYYLHSANYCSVPLNKKLFKILKYF